jgi:hypothetical protein
MVLEKFVVHVLAVPQCCMSTTCGSVDAKGMLDRFVAQGLACWYYGFPAVVDMSVFCSLNLMFYGAMLVWNLFWAGS